MFIQNILNRTCFSSPNICWKNIRISRMVGWYPITHSRAFIKTPFQSPFVRKAGRWKADKLKEDWIYFYRQASLTLSCGLDSLNIIILSILYSTRSLGAIRAPTSSSRPFEPLDMSFAPFGRSGQVIHASWYKICNINFYKRN